MRSPGSLWQRVWPGPHALPPTGGGALSFPAPSEALGVTWELQAATSPLAEEAAARSAGIDW